MALRRHERDKAMVWGRGNVKENRKPSDYILAWYNHSKKSKNDNFIGYLGSIHPVPESQS